MRVLKLLPPKLVLFSSKSWLNFLRHSGRSPMRWLPVEKSCPDSVETRNGAFPSKQRACTALEVFALIRSCQLSFSYKGIAWCLRSRVVLLRRISLDGEDVECAKTRATRTATLDSMHCGHWSREKGDNKGCLKKEIK
eukprot:s1531_g22.t1